MFILMSARDMRRLRDHQQQDALPRFDSTLQHVSCLEAPFMHTLHVTLKTHWRWASAAYKRHHTHGPSHTLCFWWQELWYNQPVRLCCDCGVPPSNTLVRWPTGFATSRHQLFSSCKGHPLITASRATTISRQCSAHSRTHPAARSHEGARAIRLPFPEIKSMHNAVVALGVLLSNTYRPSAAAQHTGAQHARQATTTAPFSYT